MLLFDSIGPNPKVVRMSIAERGNSGIPTQTVDLLGGENRQPAYLAKNPTGGLPALELDDGSYLTEITAICEYDEIAPGGPSLIAATAKERGETRMWTRRIDLGIVEPLTAGFRYSEGLKMFSKRMHCIPQAADDLRAMAKEKLTWLDGQIASRQFVCGDRLTLADILLFAFLQFAGSMRQPLDPAIPVWPRGTSRWRGGQAQPRKARLERVETDRNAHAAAASKRCGRDSPDCSGNRRRPDSKTQRLVHHRCPPLVLDHRQEGLVRRMVIGRAE